MFTNVFIHEFTTEKWKSCVANIQNLAIVRWNWWTSQMTTPWTRKEKWKFMRWDEFYRQTQDISGRESHPGLLCNNFLRPFNIIYLLTGVPLSSFYGSHEGEPSSQALQQANLTGGSSMRKYWGNVLWGRITNLQSNSSIPSPWIWADSPLLIIYNYLCIDLI